MTGRAAILVFAAVALIGAFGDAPSACAEDGAPYPTVARGKGETCVRDTAFMRENHMELLLNQRDETMRDGIRSKRESLKECVSCHAVAGADGLPVGFESPKHFCRACHDYTAVKIDCFECHAARPPPLEGARLAPPGIAPFHLAGHLAGHLARVAAK